MIRIFLIVLLLLGAKNAMAEEQKATFAGGCFWCMQSPFDKTEGVLKTIVGYTGGKKYKPTYEEVSSGITGHTESIEVIYNPDVVSYEKLLDIFWHNIDPLDGRGQFCDKGEQYRSAIFYQNDEQKIAALESKKQIEEKLGPVATSITAATEFFPAEDYHQDYYKKNPIRYKYYRFGCGRDKRLEKIWSKN